MEDKSEIYGKWTVKQLVIELKKRNAHSTGKKADLVKRLCDYDKINIKAKSEEGLSKYTLVLPDATLFRDLNSSHNINIEKNFELQYLKSIKAPTVNIKGEEMYKERMLLSLRKALNDKNETFLCGRVKSQFRKSIVYNVNIKITSYKCISDTVCECGSGEGPSAHCKHVHVIFEAMKDFLNTKTIKLRETCTEKLQTFHQTAKYTGEPMMIKNSSFKRLTVLENKLENYDPRPMKFRKMDKYYENFRNKCINFAGSSMVTFPELQLFEPANLFAVYNDHDYHEEHIEDHFLKEMNLKNITKDQRLQIEAETRGQSNNKLWFEIRDMHLNSSNFGSICSSKSPEKIVLDLINPKDLSHLPAIIHGKKYELHALKLFEQKTGFQVHECGTFISLEYPFLAASPDGIINDDNSIEIKCPFSCKDQFITPEKIEYLYLCDREGFYKLKKEHNYYFQIQGQLLCSGRKKCFFIVYTLKDILIQEIKRDEEFIKKMVEKLESFYENYFKKSIFQKYLYKNF